MGQPISRAQAVKIVGGEKALRKLQEASKDGKLADLLYSVELHAFLRGAATRYELCGRQRDIDLIMGRL